MKLPNVRASFVAATDRLLCSVEFSSRIGDRMHQIGNALGFTCPGSREKLAARPTSVGRTGMAGCVLIGMASCVATPWSLEDAREAKRGDASNRGCCRGGGRAHFHRRPGGVRQSAAVGPPLPGRAGGI